MSQLAAKKVTANQVTTAAALGSTALSAVFILYGTQHRLFLLLPLWMMIRMALNAIDGMLAREFNQQSMLGAYLNELCDVISDAALFIPFALLAPFSFYWVALVIFLATLSEFAGVMGLTIGASRRYDGPLGKSDRAFTFGTLGLWMGIAGSLPQWLHWLMPLLAILLAVTTVNRIIRALAEMKTAID